jgi:hypothetical protein
MRARIAWFVMAHQKPRQLRWIIEALAAGSPEELILLHIDLKSPLGRKPNAEACCGWPGSFGRNIRTCI